MPKRLLFRKETIYLQCSKTFGGSHDLPHFATAGFFVYLPQTRHSGVAPP
ncbi:TPA_asm: hypothetical protein [Porphyromonas phage phage020a_SJD2]|uniref:Uncharacterized protein n=2 Tax=Viruses TaxID=10239 RepID=A0AAT9JE45_9CAUD